MDVSTLDAMGRSLGHRGPDASGDWSDGECALTHRRLSIIDLAGSPQPMVSADRRWVVAFNGEIFNFAEVRGSLDYPFKTHGDTEVLLAAFAQKGIAGLDPLVGQFAFAAYDSVERELWLVRDRLGVLPMYFHLDHSRVAFASEIKALLPALSRGPTVDLASLDAYLTARAVPAPYTLFEGVRKVRPGHAVRIDRDGRIREIEYWDLPDDILSVSREESVELVHDALQRAVASCRIADVPVGAYLSGGVDSSLIVAMMARQTPGMVETFSAGFGDRRLDELDHARTVSQHVGTRHHEVLVAPRDFQELWPRLTWHRDAPISEPADIAVFRLAQEARQRVKVILSGEGSDELFAGYPKYRVAPFVARVDIVPGKVRRPMVRGLEWALPKRLSRVRIATRVMAEDSDERIRAWFAPFTSHERDAILGSLPRRPVEPKVGGGDLVREMLKADCGSWLSDNLLERGDRMSMAASLELRPPFLDHRLVNLAFQLPSTVKIHGGRASGSSSKWPSDIFLKTSCTEENRGFGCRLTSGSVVALEAWHGNVSPTAPPSSARPSTDRPSIPSSGATTRDEATRRSGSGRCSRSRSGTRSSSVKVAPTEVRQSDPDLSAGSRVGVVSWPAEPTRSLPAARTTTRPASASSHRSGRCHHSTFRAEVAGGGAERSPRL